MSFSGKIYFFQKKKGLVMDFQKSNFDPDLTNLDSIPEDDSMWESLDEILADNNLPYEDVNLDYDPEEEIIANYKPLSISEYEKLIYSNIGKRVTKEMKRRHKKRYDVSPDNPELLSKVRRGKNYPKTNRYLLTGNITQDITDNLGFDEYSLVWGDQQELMDNLRILFISGLSFLNYDYSNNDVKKLIELSLFECFSYSSRHAEEMANLPNSPFDSPSSTDLVLYIEAVDYIYFYLEQDFKKVHYNFFKKLVTKKLPNNIEKFIIREIPILLKDFLSERKNIGKQTYDLMFSIFSTNLKHEFFLSESKLEDDQTYKTLQNMSKSGEKYIDYLVKYQKETDPYYLKRQQKLLNDLNKP